MSTIAEIIDRIRALASDATGIDMELDKAHGVDNELGIDHFDRKFVVRRYATNAAEMQLEEYLSAIDEETLRRIEAVMYSGRNGTLAAHERDALRTSNPTKADFVPPHCVSKNVTGWGRCFM